MRCLQSSNYSQGRAFAIGYGVNHFAATVDTVSAGEIFGIGGLASGAVDLNAAVFDFDRAKSFEKSEQR